MMYTASFAQSESARMKAEGDSKAENVRRLDEMGIDVLSITIVSPFVDRRARILMFNLPERT